MAVALSPSVKDLSAAEARERLQRQKNRAARERLMQSQAAIRTSNTIGRKIGALAMGQIRAGDVKIGGKFRLATAVGIAGLIMEIADQKSSIGAGVSGGLGVGLDIGLYSWSAENQRPMMAGAELALKGLLRDDT